MIDASTILDTVYKTLQDTRRVTWTEDEVLAYLNEALRATAGVKSDMFVVQGFVTPVAGISQQIPSDGVAFMDITHNQATGRVVTQVDKALLEEASRFWPAATQQAEAEHFTFDPRYPLLYTIFPPNNGAGSVFLKYGAVPPELTTVYQSLDVPDSYQDALVNFTLYRCYAKNTKDQDLAKSMACRQMWGSALGLKSQSLVAVAPKTSESPGA